MVGEVSRGEERGRDELDEARTEREGREGLGRRWHAAGEASCARLVMLIDARTEE
jgi:hypothetical protein